MGSGKASRKSHHAAPASLEMILVTVRRGEVEQVALGGRKVWPLLLTWCLCKAAPTWGVQDAGGRGRASPIGCSQQPRVPDTGQIKGCFLHEGPLCLQGRAPRCCASCTILTTTTLAAPPSLPAFQEGQAGQVPTAQDQMPGELCEEQMPGGIRECQEVLAVPVPPSPSQPLVLHLP